MSSLIPEKAIHNYMEHDESEKHHKWSKGYLLVDVTDELFPNVKRSEDRKKFFDEFASMVGKSPETVRIEYRTAKQFPEGKRAEDRSFHDHWICLQGSSDEDANDWLGFAIEKGLFGKRLQRVVKQVKQIEEARLLTDDELEAIASGDGGSKSVTLDGVVIERRGLNITIQLNKVEDIQLRKSVRLVVL